MSFIPKKYNLKRNKKLVVVISIIGIFFVGMYGSFQASQAVTSIWEIDAEFASIVINGNEISFDEIENYYEKSYTKIVLDYDGDPEGKVSTMSSDGLLPTHEWSLGPVFPTNEDGEPIDDVIPVNISEADGKKYLHFYFGFSMSMLTRGSNEDISSEDISMFDYYDQVLKSLYEYPEFAPATIGATVGIRLEENEEKWDTLCGVEDIDVLRTRKRYTAAESMDESPNIEDFNDDHEWLKFYEEGSISSINTEVDLTASEGHNAKVSTSARLKPGSEYAPTIAFTTAWTDGTFNIYDVECIVDYYCKVTLTYSLASDVADYLEGRYDYIEPEPEHESNFWEFLSGIFWWAAEELMKILGIDNLILGAVIVSVIVIIVLVVIFKLLFGGRGSSTIIIQSGRRTRY